jgi:hypothetical protein
VVVTQGDYFSAHAVKIAANDDPSPVMMWKANGDESRLLYLS